MAQTQISSSKAETYPSARLRAGRWGVEIECFLSDQAIRELGISIGSYHHGHPLPSPFPQACPERSERGWTAERDGSLRTDRAAGLLELDRVVVLRGAVRGEPLRERAQRLLAGQPLAAQERLQLHQA